MGADSPIGQIEADVLEELVDVLVVKAGEHRAPHHVLPSGHQPFLGAEVALLTAVDQCAVTLYRVDEDYFDGL
ncbi:hypothetical protein M3697_12440 [Janibacter melonis]|uniref:hypothetical protein n=1 Tax=Janibacter melonis TaxID=262209 RepID=UPI00204417C9|nr:hypothetical protein [Janibacter melonis]MCM3555905.1 hypothetical protein [Janibacter melonis]